MIIYDIYNNDDIYMSHNSVRIKKILNWSLLFLQWIERKHSVINIFKINNWKQGVNSTKFVHTL